MGSQPQNIAHQANGTFWYFNYSERLCFDGHGLTPQVAFQIDLVPAPGSPLLLDLAGLAGSCRW